VPLVVCLGLDLHSRRGRDVSQVWCDISAYSLSFCRVIRIYEWTAATRIIDVILHGVALHPPRRISPSEFYCCRCPRCVPCLSFPTCTNHPSRRIHPTRLPLHHPRQHRAPISAYSASYTVTKCHPLCLLRAHSSPHSCALWLPHGAHAPRAGSCPRVRTSTLPPRSPASSIAA
jgi:hypothetical protein